jgi:hypothetical protein
MTVGDIDLNPIRIRLSEFAMPLSKLEGDPRRAAQLWTKWDTKFEAPSSFLSSRSCSFGSFFRLDAGL